MWYLEDGLSSHKCYYAGRDTKKSTTHVGQFGDGGVWEPQAFRTKADALAARKRLRDELDSVDKWQASYFNPVFIAS